MLNDSKHASRVYVVAICGLVFSRVIGSPGAVHAAFETEGWTY